MTRFVAHVHKELRDQRAPLIAVFVALPVLTFLAFWGLEDHLLEADADDAAGVIVPIALALYLLALAGDVFAGDLRRGTVDFLRRQPGGLGHGFLAKVTLTFAGLVVVFFWQAALLQFAWALWGRTVLPEFGVLVDGALSTRYTIGAALLTSWILLTSTWLRQGGIALLLAPMLAAVLVLPGYLWAQAHPTLGRYLFREIEGGLWWLLGFVALLPLFAAAWSWLGGRRVVRSAWSAAWRGAAAMLLLSSVAYAGSAAWIDGRLELTPESSDLHIADGMVSPDGSRLYLRVFGDAHRGPYEYHSPARTPPRTWIVDVSTGRTSDLGDWGEGITGPPLRGLRYHRGWYGSSLAPPPKIVQYRESPDGGKRLAVWVDADSGDVLKVVPTDARTKDVAAWINEAGRLTSTVRDESGRRAWLPPPGNAMYVEAGDGRFRSLSIPYGFCPQHAVHGGWYGWSADSRSMALLDATTGEVHASPHHAQKHVMGPRRVLYGTRALIDPKTGEETPARGAPEKPVTVLCALDSTTVLYRTLRVPHRLVMWNPVKGTSEPLTPPGQSVDAFWHQGVDASGRRAFVLKHDDGWDIAVLDPDTHELRYRARGRSAQPWLMALLPDGTAFGIEAWKRVYRYGPGPDEVERIFPR